VSWSATQIVLTFGSQYGTLNYHFTNGDNFVAFAMGYYWGGLISGLS
jgi:hypothetical protein